MLNILFIRASIEAQSLVTKLALTRSRETYIFLVLCEIFLKLFFCTSYGKLKPAPRRESLLLQRLSGHETHLSQSHLSTECWTVSSSEIDRTYTVRGHYPFPCPRTIAAILVNVTYQRNVDDSGCPTSPFLYFLSLSWSPGRLGKLMLCIRKSLI